MKINIAIGTDENYVKQSCVLIKSIMEAAKEDCKYEFYILIDKDVSVKSKKYFLLFEKQYSYCHIIFKQIDNQIRDAYIRIKHITPVTYARLLLPDLLDEEKCVYLDSDIIVCEDIAELFAISMDEYEIAGVKAPHYHQLPDQGREYMRQTGIPSMDRYINAGVLLLNLDLMRKNCFTQKAMQLISRPFPTQDQDIINLLSYHKIKHLPFKYNVPAVYCSDWNPELINKVFTQEEWEEGIKNPNIIHYCGLWKPWEDFKVLFADKWWEVCRMTDVFSDFMLERQDIFYYYGVIMQKPLWKCMEFSNEWYNEVNKFPCIYVYGAGEKGKEVLLRLHENSIGVEAVLVSKKEGNELTIENVPVIEFSKQIDHEALILIGVSKLYKKEIRDKLFQEGYMNVFVFNNI